MPAANKMQNNCTKTDFSNPATGCDKMAVLARNADITGYRLAGIGTPSQFRNRESLAPVPGVSCGLRSLRPESIPDRFGWRGSRTSTDRDRGKPHRPSMQGLIALIGLLNGLDGTDAPCVFDHSDQGTKSPLKVLLRNSTHSSGKHYPLESRRSGKDRRLGLQDYPNPIR